MNQSENMIRQVAQVMISVLNEKQLRLLAGSLAIGYGYEGQKIVSNYFDLTPKTMCKAVVEINSGEYLEQPESGRARKPGGGRKNALEKNPELLGFIYGILQENTYGNPMSVISYTSLSLRDIDISNQKKLPFHFFQSSHN